MSAPCEAANFASSICLSLLQSRVVPGEAGGTDVCRRAKDSLPFLLLLTVLTGPEADGLLAANTVGSSIVGGSSGFFPFQLEVLDVGDKASEGDIGVFAISTDTARSFPFPLLVAGTRPGVAGNTSVPSTSAERVRSFL